MYFDPWPERLTNGVISKYALYHVPEVWVQVRVKLLAWKSQFLMNMSQFRKH